MYLLLITEIGLHNFLLHENVELHRGNNNTGIRLGIRQTVHPSTWIWNSVIKVFPTDR